MFAGGFNQCAASDLFSLVPGRMANAFAAKEPYLDAEVFPFLRSALNFPFPGSKDFMASVAAQEICLQFAGKWRRIDH
jgi:hypothetical protein